MNLNKKKLEKRVNELSKDLGTIKLKEMLAGGVVSDVYSATFETADEKSKKIVVKYTKKDISLGKIFSRMDKKYTLLKAQAVHNLDITLQRTLSVATPNIIQHFAHDNITLMDDFTNIGYELLQSRLINKRIPGGTAKELGFTLAIIRNDLEKIGKTYTQLEESQSQFNERFLELKVLLYNARMDMFNEIEKDFLLNKKGGIIWTDGDQKNFAIDANGKVMVFDLGRSIICDSDFMLPNLLGHLGLFIIADYLENGLDFLKVCRQSFEKKYLEFNPSYQLEERKFINYFTASLLHRGMAMRWIDPKIADNIGEDSLKYSCMHFGDIVFDRDQRILSVDKMYSVLKIVADLAAVGTYKRK